ncbi:MAG TPA: ABC transporter permease [Phototrophicaceae bacterium]|nr:ABC transporter permease [Phototrophicaceae bacterium]
MSAATENLPMILKPRSRWSSWRATVAGWPTGMKIGVIILILVALVGIFAPVLTPYNPIIGDFSSALVPPGWAHPFGTDNLGRDVLSRVIYGARIDLEIGFIATYVPFAYGIILGAIAGYVGGWFDTVLMRIVDIAIAFPFLVLIIVILAILGPGIQNMYIAVFLAGWTIYARLARAEMLVIREQEYMLAARALGYGKLRIIFRHALPNLIQSSIVFSMSDFVLNILLASALSYFGIGVQPPAPEWGAIINDGRDYLLQAWWISTLPGIAVIITGVGVSLIGDGLGKILGQRNG